MPNSKFVHSRRTPFAFYVQGCRKEFERTHPNQTPNYTEFIQDCITNWTNMRGSDKHEYEALAKADVIRYNNEKGISPVKPKLEVPTKIRKLNDDRRQPLSAFYWFCQDQRSVVMQEHPDFDQGQAAVEMGRRWIAASSAIKKEYEEMSENGPFPQF